MQAIAEENADNIVFECAKIKHQMIEHAEDVFNDAVTGISEGLGDE